MTKTLLTVSYALEVDEDELGEFAIALEKSIKKGIRQAIAESGREITSEDVETLEGLVDYYGATLTLKQPLFEGMETEK